MTDGSLKLDRQASQSDTPSPDRDNYECIPPQRLDRGLRGRNREGARPQAVVPYVLV